MSDVITACVADLTTKVKDIGEFGSSGKEKVFSIYSEDDLLDKSKLIKFPAVGVMYEGLRSVPGADPSRQGLGAEIGVALVLLMETKSVAGINSQNEAVRLLGLMRSAIKVTVAPTQHKWRFISEVPGGVLGNAVVYVQRWSTAAPNP
ncbi:MAG: hypothetical protein E6Q97_33445 [Desulfurellales bacterium]|jgi:hypothetical protein|nr:MAG: hypothetical protein E6Q97_33445 [Desulfurellales bacterium]